MGWFPGRHSYFHLWSFRLNRVESGLIGAILANWAEVYLYFTNHEKAFTHTLFRNRYTFWWAHVASVSLSRTRCGQTQPAQPEQ